MLAALLDEAARREGLPSAGRGSEVGKFWGSGTGLGKSVSVSLRKNGP